jgi:hypothetical protein
MMCPKPMREPKEKNSYNSLQQRKSKPKKEIQEWRRNILSHHESKPSRADRAEFSKEVVAELIKEVDGKCQCGCGRPDTETHHVMTRTRDGRGVKSNGMRVNGICNQRFHDNEEELQHWIEVYRKKYGDNFWFDEQDWEQYNRKQAATREVEDAHRQRMDALEPVMSLLSTAAGRKLKTAEIRLLDGLDTRETTTLVKLMQDVVEGMLPVQNPMSMPPVNDSKVKKSNLK